MELSYLLIVFVCSAFASDPVIKSPSGTFLGSTLTAWNNEIYNAFRGIPYAKPPVGDLRFRPPVAVPPIDGLYNAKDFKPFCVQVNVLPNQFGLGQEDCLYLNVFTPRFADRDDGNLKKVFVFFHGGGNLNGFPDVYIPGSLVTEHDVIVVTVAYRVGYLGLLSTLSPACEGNFHLKDQLLSLHWVKENILEFGGDPAGITIGGESAGAMDTTLLTLVPGSRDLFARAYAQSGSTGTRNSIVITNPIPEAIKLSRRLGCVKNDQSDPVSESEFDEIVECLRRVPASSFSNNGTSDIPYLHAVLYGDLFPASIEELFSNEDYLKSIKFFDRDYLVGLDDNEGDLFTLLNDYALSTLPEEVRKVMTPQILFQNTIKTFLAPIFGPVSQEVIERIVDYYESSPEVHPLADFGADALFHVATIQYVTAAAAGRSPDNSRVYLFRFVHNPEWLLPPIKGMLHGLDILYLFDMDIETGIKIIPLKVDINKWNEKDNQLRQKFIRMIADFINTGNPGRSLTSELPAGWPGFDKKLQQYLQFGLTSEVKHHLLSERLKLWSEQIPQWIKEFPVTKQHEEL